MVPFVLESFRAAASLAYHIQVAFGMTADLMTAWNRFRERQPPFPSPLYRYFSPAGIATLRTQQICFCPPRHFNDPFDCLPVRDFNREANRTEAIMLEDFAQSAAIRDLPRKERRQKFIAYRKAVRKSVNSNRRRLEEIHESTDLDFKDEMGVGVLCLTRSRDSLLMWAHYAAAHTGFVLEFNSECRPFRQLGILQRVIYSAERPEFTAREPFDGQFVLHRLKSPQWSYEDEFRMFRPLQACTPVKSARGTRHFAPFPLSCIKAIYLGCQSAKELEAEAEAALKGTGIPVFKAALSQKQFVLEFKSLTAVKTGEQA